MQIVGPDVDRNLSVGAPTCGYRLTSITLDAIDFYRLGKLSPELLHDWFNHWGCRFAPTIGVTMSDQEIEALIQDKGLTAPRITPEHIESVIEEELYFTAADGMWARGIQMPEDSPSRLLTICVLILQNDFTVIGHSACVSAENFDEDVGRKVARAKAVDQIWLLEGYLLRERLFDESAT